MFVSTIEYPTNILNVEWWSVSSEDESVAVTVMDVTKFFVSVMGNDVNESMYDISALYAPLLDMNTFTSGSLLFKFLFILINFDIRIHKNKIKYDDI